MEEFEFVGIPLSVDVIEVGVWLCAYPSRCRGDCWSLGFVPIPLSVEVIVVGLVPYPLVRGDCCCALPLV